MFRVAEQYYIVRSPEMKFIFILTAMLLWPLTGQEKLFSQTEPWNQSSFNRSSWGAERRVLDYQFDRADRELSPDRWMEEARRGIMTARAVWAEMAPEIFLDAEANAQFMEWTEKELEARFTRWLLERFFGTGIEVPADAVFRKTGEAGKYFIYFTGPDGTILYDPATGDPNVIRPGDEDYDFAENLLSWREMTHGTAETELQYYQSGIMETYPELLMYIPIERKDEFERKLAAAGDQAVLSLKHEFEATLAREERYFTAQRLGDVWSLRKKSEDRSAAAIGTMLIEEARQACADGIASIEARIEAARADSVDLTLAGNQWLEEYREQFKRGLEAWESAEERFLLRRIEWERSAEQAFHEGMETWSAVFTRFEEERRKWEDEARLLFLEGEEFFAQASQTLEEAIAAAKAEFEKDSKLRTGAASERIGALVNMYLLSSSAAEESRKNINFWVGRYREAKPGASIPSGNEDIERWVDNELRRLGNTANGLEKFILEELQNCLAMHRNYSGKIQKNFEALAKELYSASGIRDHYETELLRAEVELEYWKNRTVMAEAVTAYAEAMDAGRMTAAESLDAWEKAKAAYDEAAALFGEADESLRAGGAELSAARDIFAEASEKMRDASDALESLRQNYQFLIAASGNTGSDIVAEDLASLYLRLSAEQEILGSTAETSPWGKFFSMARELETLYLEETRKEILKQIIAGDEDTLGSLADLAGKVESGAFPEGGHILNLAEILLEENRINAAQYDLLLSALLNSSQSRAENELEIRLAAISLLIEKESSTDWYFSVRNTGRTEIPGSALQNIEARLFNDWEMDMLHLLKARAELELEALGFIGGNEAGQEAVILASLYTGDETKRLQDRELLEHILELLNAGTPTEDERVLFFLSGGSFVTAEYGQELFEVFLSGYVRREEFSRNLYDMYIGFSDLAMIIIQENLERGIGQLRRLWETLGIETNERVFPPSGAIINALTEMDGDSTLGIPPLIFILDEIFYYLPPWLEFPFGMWKENLIEYCASPSDDTLALAERQDDLLNTALLLLQNETLKIETADFEIEAARYLNDPMLQLTGTVFDSAGIHYYGDYETVIEELLDHYSMEKYLMEEIDRLSSLLDTFNQGLESMEHELGSVSAEITLAEENFAELIEAYQEAADNFQHAGAAYDALYGDLERALKNLEDSRKVFETQDAIRLWAETAYLDARKPAEELAYYREKAERAFDALELLKSLSTDKKISEAEKYEDAYARYRESLSLFALSLDALHKLERAIEAEQERNETSYHAYQHYLSQMGKSFFIEENYVSPDDKSKWDIRDMISIDDNGFLVFSLDNNGTLSGSDAERSEMLREYFTPNISTADEPYMVSSFELALRELNTALLGSGLTKNKYDQMALARDYLIRAIAGRNPGINEVQRWYNTAAITRNDTLGNMIVDPAANMKVHEIVSFFTHGDRINSAQINSWNSLDAHTRKALEFYTILTLLGGGGNNSAFFSRVTEYTEYDTVLDYANVEYNFYRKRAKKPLIGLIYKNRYKVIRATRNALANPRNYLGAQINLAHQKLTETLFTVDEKLDAYKDSSEKLALLKGEKIEGIHWEDIERSLDSANGFNGDVLFLREIWEQLGGDSGSAVYDVPQALKMLLERSRDLMEENSRHLYQVWQAGEEERASHEISYRELYNAFLAGHADKKDLHAAAVLSFNEAVPFGKAHLENTGNALVETLLRFAELGLSGTAESFLLAGEYAGIISRVWEEKYSAELTIRVNEWELQQRGIQEKLVRWRESADIILEQGRTAWKEGEEKLREAHNVWAKTFGEEYARISDAWTAAYLEGLQDKEAWAAAALQAADKASSAAAIALIGSSAEAGARAMDTRDPLGFMNLPDMREGGKILSDLLERTGTGALSNAFSSIRASAGTLAAVVRTGLSGGEIWNSASVMTEVSSLARTVREEFETRESRKMAFMVMNTSHNLYMSLEENIREANEQFIKQMDETFIIGGQWRRTGTGYIKNVIVHSTFVNSVITERAEVEGYRNFILVQTDLPVYTDEEDLRNLNVFQADALIESIYSEINELFGKIFDPGTGEFAVHIGDRPGIRPKPDIGKGRSGIFDSLGSGESGRLFAEFYYWMFKEQLGISAVAAAPWDKPLWDSRDSSINAPSIRNSVNVVLSSVILIAGAVASPFTAGTSFLGGIALVAALNSVDDLVFYAMDVTGGYKSYGEAGVEFGKTLVSNTVNAASGSLSSGAGSLVNKTVTSGLKTFAAGTINSAVASVYYDNNKGLGFSAESFTQGFKGSSIGALSGMTGTFTSGLMDLGLEGFIKNLYTDGRALSNLAGGLASQGVNYAFGNDFTLNLFDAGAFFETAASAGLVEMRLGRNGIGFELGSGGVNASIGTLVSAAKGFEAWKVNGELLFSKNQNSRTYAKSMRTLYGGDNYNRSEYEAILAGRTVIEERREAESTQSIYDAASGIKTIYLGSDALDDGSRFGLSVIFSHESYRDGIDNGEIGQKTETNNSVIGHILTAIALENTYGKGVVSDSMSKEAEEFRNAVSTNDASTIAEIVGRYDSSADYWRLLPDGNLEYDGFATLVDSYGNVIRSAASMGLKETQVEGALIEILGLSSSNSEDVQWVRYLMISSGITHSHSYDPEQWYWRGTHDVRTSGADGSFTINSQDLTELNMGKTISLSMISGVYSMIENRAEAIEKFVNNTYGSPIDFLNHSDALPAQAMLSAVHTAPELKMIHANRIFLNDALQNGMNIDSMIEGNAKRTQGFGKISAMLRLATSSIPGAAWFQEIHTGIDYGRGGISISVPGGHWEFIRGDNHRAFFQLYGSSLRMRIQHVNPDEVNTIAPNTIFGGENSRIMNYPTQSYGSGTGPHIHIDMTMRLPHANSYTRQFVDPDTLKAGSRLNYSFSYFDADKNKMPGNSGYFHRY